MRTAKFLFDPLSIDGKVVLASFANGGDIPFAIHDYNIVKTAEDKCRNVNFLIFFVFYLELINYFHIFVARFIGFRHYEIVFRGW